MSNKRILNLENDQVTFRYQDGGTRQQRTCTLSAEAFIQRFPQHVLPKGLVKVRYYGLLAPGNRKRLAQAKQLLGKETDGRNDPQPSDVDHTEGYHDGHLPSLQLTDDCHSTHSATCALPALT